MKSLKFFWQGFFILLGISSLLIQCFLLREVNLLFYGNEIFYGLGLGTWLLLVGLGSHLGNRLKKLPGQKLYSISLLILAVLIFPIAIIFLRYISSVFTLSGEIPKLLVMPFIGISFLSICLPLGLNFAISVKLWLKKEGKQAANQAYFWETLGLLIGGIIFIFLSSTFFPLWKQINQTTLRWHYPNLTRVINSAYNQIAVSKKENQLSFFINGQLSFTNQESLENEKFINLIKPFVQNTRETLVFANPFLANQIASELSADPVNFLEIDPRLAEIEKEFFGQKVMTLVGDPRKLLKISDKKWGLVIYNPGNPQTFLTNRYFTKESFEEIKNCLEENGIFILTFYLPTDYQSKEALDFGRTIYQTFVAVFKNNYFLNQEDQIILIGGKKEVIIQEDKITQKWEKYFWLTVEKEKKREIEKNLSLKKEKINTDLNQVAVFYQQLFQQTILATKLPVFLVKTFKIFILFLVGTYLFLLFKIKGKFYLASLISSCSFVSISLEAIIIFLFQVKIGYLFSQVSLIFAVFLSGIAFGVQINQLVKNKIILVKTVLAIFIFSVLLFWLFLTNNLSQHSVFWFISAFVFGAFSGTIYGAVNSLFLKKNSSGSFIYSFDLFGSSLGAFLTSGFLFPVLGAKTLLSGLAAILCLNLISLIAKPRLSG